MDSLSDMLAKRPTPVEPEESRLLKLYVQKKYDVTPLINISEFYITMAVPSAALAATLRFDEAQMKIDCKLTKKLRIRIGTK